MGNDLSIDNESLQFQRDLELPYNTAYNMSQPIGSQTTDMPATASRTLVRTHKDIRQITTVSEGQQNSIDMSDIKRLASIPPFLPLLHNYLNLPQLRRLNASIDQADVTLLKAVDSNSSDDRTSLFSGRSEAKQEQLLKLKPLGLSHRPILDLCRLCENVLKNAAEVIDSDQSSINASIRQMDVLVHSLHLQIMEHRTNVSRVTDQLSKVGDMQIALTRVNNTLSRIIPVLSQLNENLPEHLQLTDLI